MTRTDAILAISSGFSTTSSKAHKTAPVPTMGGKSVETLCYFGVLKANFPPQLYDSNPSPPNNVGFHVSRIKFFPKEHWKGGGGSGVALNVNRISNGIGKWN